MAPESQAPGSEEAVDVISPSPQILRIDYFGHPVEIAAKIRREGKVCLIFLHGIGCTKESFDYAFQSRELKDYTICTFDFPGHGQSNNLPETDYSLQLYADITDLVIQRLFCDQFCIVGHSMGGAVGIIAAQGRSDIKCFVNADGNLIAQDCGLASREIADQGLAEFISDGYDQFVATLRTSSRNDLNCWGEWCAKADPHALHQASASLVEWSDSGKLLELFNALPCKAYLYGDQDDKQYVLNHVSNVMISTVPDSGHFMMMDNPSSFYRIISETLAACAARTARIPSDEPLSLF